MRDGDRSTEGFRCALCAFECHADYYGRRPPWNTKIVLLEDAWVIRDPLGSADHPLCVGAPCQVWCADPHRRASGSPCPSSLSASLAVNARSAQPQGVHCSTQSGSARTAPSCRTCRCGAAPSTSVEARPEQCYSTRRAGAAASGFAATTTLTSSWSPSTIRCGCTAMWAGTRSMQRVVVGHETEGG